MTNAQVIKIADLFINTENSTVRKIASMTDYSKSTIHRVITEDILKVTGCKDRYLKCQEILLKNKNERAIRGGAATKEKYSKLKNIDN